MRLPALCLLLPLACVAQDVSRYVLVLNDPPASASHGTAAIEAARQRNVTAHTAVKQELVSRRIHINTETHTLLNAIFVAADSAQAAQLSAIPGVRYVFKGKRFRRSLDHAEQLINVPAAWNFLGGVGNAGAGVKIGIIDTGIQSSHPAFQDAGLTAPAGFPICSMAQPPGGTAAQTLDCTQYTNNKIIVARSYVPYLAQGSAAASRPDDNTPRDRMGHGTAVAMAAAGETNTGPADTITGVAPKAFLGSYKVFGSPGLNDFASDEAVIKALEDAFNDGMDVAVLSLGSPVFYSPLDSGAACNITPGEACDPEATAVQNAVSSGMVVVVSAGNEGQTGAVQPTLSSIGTPADAPNAIAVAATTNSHQWSNSLSVSGLGTIRSLLGAGPAPDPALAVRLSDVASVGDPLGCTALPANSLTGTYALVQRGVCTFVIKVQNLQAAGAAGAIITNTQGDNSIFTPGSLGGGATAIPAVDIGYDDGQAIRNLITPNRNPAASMSTALQAFEVSTANQVAPFSSRGPVTGGGSVKPDVAAVGTDLYLAGQTYDPNGDLYSPTGYLIAAGTSFSAPQVAGIAALVRQVNPGLSALQIKSAVVNSATQDVTDSGAAASVMAVGAGKANAATALVANVTAIPTSASFGNLSARSLPLTRQIQLTNTASAPLTLSIAINRRTPETTAHLSVDLPNVTIPAGQSQNINLLLSGGLPAPGSFEGYITVQGGASTLQIPYLYVVGDGVPFNIVPLVGDGDDGTVGKPTTEGLIIVQLTDRYGVPIPNVPVHFSVVTGGGSLRNQDPATDSNGLAGAEPVLGPAPGSNEFAATLGGLTTTFTSTALAQPTIANKGVVDAAAFQSGVAVSPGSYIAVFGSNLAPGTSTFSTPYLPISLNKVSASFDTATTSVPGHLYFVTPGQVNLQVPWELQGQTSAQMKISVQDSSGNLYTVPLAPYSPGIFPIQVSGATYAAARDENFKVIGPANPALQGHNIQIYCNGLGAVSNQPPSGDPTPVGTLSQTVATPAVSIGGLPAQVLFSGLTPTAIGLYQLNVTVPNTGPGTKRVMVTIGNAVSNTLNIVVQ